VALAETFVTPTETFVHSGEATVKSTKSAAVETTKSAAMKSAAMKSAAMKSAAVETPTPAAVETPTPASAMWPSVGKIWLTERGGAQHSRCDGQNPSVLRPGFNFA
jgi:hypothetical protein